MNKYLISADIEGITGVVNKEFSKESGRYYALACRYMLSDVNAVIEGIIDVDSDSEIVVRDAHGSSAVNLNLEHLHPKARLIQGWDAVQNMFAGLEEDFKGVFLVGYHAGGQNVHAVLGHTMNSLIHSVKVNGRLLNEAGIFALYAGSYNIPVAFISGDDHAIKEANDQFDSIVGVVVKESHGRDSANSLSLEQAQKLLKKNSSEAVTRLQQKEFSPLKVSSPVTMEIKLYDTGVRVSTFRNLSEILKFDANYKFNFENHTITFLSQDVLEMLQRLNLLLHVVYGIQSSG